MTQSQLEILEKLNQQISGVNEYDLIYWCAGKRPGSQARLRHNPTWEHFEVALSDCQELDKLGYLNLDEQNRFTQVYSINDAGKQALLEAK